MKAPIPFFSLERQYQKNKKKFMCTIEKVLDTQSFIGGQFVQEFEKKFSNYVGAKYTIACNSGTDALWLAVKALNTPKDSIVLTTPFSFIASSSEIAPHGAHPVFIDVEETTYNIDPQKIKIWLEANAKMENGIAIHKKTGQQVVGIIPVDIFGQCADYTQIRQIAKHWNLWIIEDACQAIGTTDSQGKQAGTLGDISCFSFYPTKNLGAFGDGGCCTTDNEALAEKLLQLRNHGRKSHYNYTCQGINSRLDGIQAAILSEKLEMLAELNNSRKKIAQIYDKKLNNLDFIKLPKKLNGSHTYHQYCIQILPPLDRDQFMQNLKLVGVETNIYYPKALNEIEFLNTDPRLKNECPISKNLTKTILALPIWPELEMEEVEFICEKILLTGRERQCQKTDSLSR